MARTCLFCGGQPVTREHVYPRWLHRAMNIRGPMTYSSDGGAIRSATDFDVQLRAVCRPCNEGWLHDLERAFRALMLGSIHGIAARLVPQAQSVVALWGVKTWLLAEYAQSHIRGGGFTPPDFYRYLRQHSEPPPYLQVWLGAIDAEHRVISLLASRPVLRDEKPIGLTAALTIGNLLFQFYVPLPESPEVEVFRLAIGARLQPFLIPLWPHEVDEALWPPDGILSLEDFARLWPPMTTVSPRAG